MNFKILIKTVLLNILLIMPFIMQAQLPKWIVGSSEQNASGTFYSYGTGNLKFYELNFTGIISSTPRIIGNSIQSIKSVGTQDVMQTAVDTSTNTVLFYAFIAALGPYNAGFPAISPDTVYFAAYNSNTSADEIFGKIPTTGWGASVLESELVRKPGSISEYYFIYKTQATSLYNDNIRYVTIDAVSKTVSAPIDIVTATKSGEGMAVSQLDCSSNQRWLFVTRPETSGNITLRKCTITNSGISLPTDIYTISIPGNSIGVIGAIEISPTNDKLAIANFTTASVAKNLILFDYNNTIGAVSNEYSYTNQSGGPFVTMEFSPNGSRIYILQGGASGYSNVVYNCPVVSSNYTVTSANLMTGMSLMNSLTLELAYDGKIYVNQGESSNFIYYIPNPNSTSLSVFSTAANFFGVNQQMGSGFPDQIDGDRNPNNTINASISPTATSICTGQSVTLTASGGTTYQWSGGSSSSSSAITLSPIVTTTYYLQASNGSCIDNDSITIQVNPVPVASISGNQNICSGQSTLLTANGASSYQWSGGSTATTASISVAPATTTNYVLTPSNGTCQGNPITVAVNVTPMPNASISPTATSICDGQSVTLTASGGTTYQWSGGSSSTSSAITLSPIVTTTYYLQASNGSCIDNDSITIQVNSIPVASISGNQNICSGQSTILTANGASSYQWSGGSTATTASISVAPTTTTNYILTPSNGTCQGNPITVAVNVTPMPSASIFSTSTSICDGQPVTLTASGGTVYQWSGGSSSTSSTITLNPTITTTYYLQALNGSCIDNDSITIQVNSIPVASISGNQNICSGQTTILTASGASSYQWSGGSNAITDAIWVTPPTSTNYIVTPSNGSCLGYSSTVTVFVNPAPTAGITSINNIQNINSSITFNNQSQQGTSCITFFGDGDSLIGCNWDETIHNYADNGIYSVTMIASNRMCSDTTTINVLSEFSSVYVPNSFTPNEDGLNDFFNIYMSGIENFKLMIFNRWGELVFETTNQYQGWNGCYKGLSVEQDVYVWKLEYKTKRNGNQQQIGHVTVIK